MKMGCEAKKFNDMSKNPHVEFIVISCVTDACKGTEIHLHVTDFATEIRITASRCDMVR